MERLNLFNHIQVGLNQCSYIDDLADRIAFLITEDSRPETEKEAELSARPIRYLMSYLDLPSMGEHDRLVENNRLMDAQLGLAQACTLAMRRILDDQSQYPYDPRVFLEAVYSYYEKRTDVHS